MTPMTRRPRMGPVYPPKSPSRAKISDASLSLSATSWATGLNDMRAGVDRAVCTRTTGLADTMERARGAIDTPLNDETKAIFFSFGVAVV